MRIWGGFQEIAPTRGGAISWNSQIRIEMAPVILLVAVLNQEPVAAFHLVLVITWEGQRRIKKESLNFFLFKVGG